MALLREHTTVATYRTAPDHSYPAGAGGAWERWPWLLSSKNKNYCKNAEI